MTPPIFAPSTKVFLSNGQLNLNDVLFLQQHRSQQPQFFLSKSQPLHSGFKQHQQATTTTPSAIFSGMSKEELERYAIRAELTKGVSKFIKEGPDGQFQCGICGRDFVWQNSLVRHITCVHAGIKNFTCNRCGKAFKGRHGLKYHLEAKSCLKSKPSSHSSEQDERYDVVAHSQQASDPKQIISENKCSTEESEPSTTPAISPREDDGSLLPTLEKKRALFDALSPQETNKKPKQDHEPEVEKEVSTISQRATSSASTSSKTSTSTTGDKSSSSGQHVCSTCGKSFPLYRILSRHIKTVHESVDAFKCGLCPKAFKSKQGLQYHAQRAHPEAPSLAESRGQEISAITGGLNLSQVAQLSSQLLGGTTSDTLSSLLSLSQHGPSISAQHHPSGITSAPSNFHLSKSQHCSLPSGVSALSAIQNQHEQQKRQQQLSSVLSLLTQSSGQGNLLQNLVRQQQQNKFANLDVPSGHQRSNLLMYHPSASNACADPTTAMLQRLIQSGISEDQAKLWLAAMDSKNNSSRHKF